MGLTRFVWTFLSSPVIAGLASLYLAVEGLVDQQQRSGAGILAAAIFVGVSCIINFFRERSMTRQMTKINVRINQHLTSLIGNLGEISADNYHCWKVALYVGYWRMRWARQFPWISRKVLIRQAAVSIVSTMPLHDNRVLLENGPIGLCFREESQQIWLNPDTGITQAPADLYRLMSSEINTQLIKECGLMRVEPVTNHLDADCIGVLAIHVEPQFGPRLGGTVLEEQCARRLRIAATELHEIIRG